MAQTPQSEQILKFLLASIPQHPADIVAVTTAKFKVTRTTVHRHLNKLLEQKRVLKSGTTRDTQYYLPDSLAKAFTYQLNEELLEFNIYQNNFEPSFLQLSSTLEDILAYGFTEIFNNAIDHSKGTKITAKSEFVDNDVMISIEDNGIGIFKNLYNHFKFDDIREAILQLNKGKMTTDPENHTGEGIFFSSRIFDVFEIKANNLHYLRDNIENDWSLETLSLPIKGSIVIMKISQSSSKTLRDTFSQFEEPEDHAFDRTEICVELSRFAEERLISRSQAKRVLRNLDKFNRVTLDFKGVRLVGQGFVDEIFRVYAGQHPHVTFDYINANEDVKFMIKRGLATANR